ncbi:MAG: glutamate-5-semialdehyde dehydrogenase [Lentisphaeria bacterium]|nr:glutamate-5-semialdehyde dehydrogenase [Lentisphaeria bacterium]
MEAELENFRRELEAIGERARRAALALGGVSPEDKVRALELMARDLDAGRDGIREANRIDLDEAKRSGLSAPKIDRLTLTDARIDAMIAGLRTVAAQHDPVGRIIEKRVRPNGIEITKVAVPFGVVGIIYESRPNVTVDAAGIALKAGNAVILRGGSDAFHSNRFLAGVLNRAAMAAGIPDGAVQLLPWTSRDAVKLMLKLDKYIDLVIPRGGENLIRMVSSEATMPVLKHYKGVCHLFVDRGADFDAALRIIVNAKCQRPAVCNALETLLVHRDAAEAFLPRFAETMRAEHVEVRGDDTVRRLVPGAKPATEEDYYAEYQDLILAVRVVSDVNAAVEHINRYGSHHSDGILSTDAEAIRYFQTFVDSAVVYANASTRFTDGGEFGMGAEIGISTDKLHARGPMGVDELTSYKYLVVGNGQIRQ